MSVRTRGSLPLAEWERLHYSTDSRLRGPVPAMLTPVENANLVANREILTLQRAGSNPGNPILSGLGVRLTLGIGRGDRLTGLWLYNDRRALGLNEVANAPEAAPGFHTFDFVAGSGQTSPGSPAAGAKRNFIRWATEAGGGVERELWIKTKDADIVALNGTPALDPESLTPEAVVCQIVAEARPWLEVNVDFFVSWNDEFQKLHNAANEYLDPGFLKAYGGAAFVSVFDTSTAIEGVGVQVNPFTDSAIKDRHVIQVENTAGLKSLTFRFRSKAGSAHFVDVPVLLLLEAPDDCTCNEPAVQPCTSILLLAGTIAPAGAPSVPSDPEEAAVPDPGALLDQDLLAITLRGATVGANPKVVVSLWRLQAAATALAGARLVQFGDAVEYLPYIQDSSSPVVGGTYREPERYTIALSVSQLRSDEIALIIVHVRDGEDLSVGVPIPGPRFRDASFFPAGETGGGALCAY